MPESYVLVLDAGSSSPRCVLFRREGSIAASRSATWAMRSGSEDSTLAFEFDTNVVWKDFCRMAMGCLHDAGAAPGQVAAVTATGQRQSVVFLDVDRREVYAGPNTDLRAVFEGADIDERMRDRVYRATGHTPSMLLAPAKLAWFRNQAPDAYDRIATVFSLADWLVWRLTGVAASELTLAGEAGLLDIDRRDWCAGLLQDLDLGGIGRPPLVEPTTVVGEVTSAAADETGVLAGTPVVAAGADTQCGLLGMGATQPVVSPQAKTWAGCFNLAGRWVLESTGGDAGNSYRWLADTMFGGGEDAFRTMDQLASETPAGSDGGAGRAGSPAYGHEQPRLEARRLPVPGTRCLRRHWQGPFRQGRPGERRVYSASQPGAGRGAGRNASDQRSNRRRLRPQPALSGYPGERDRSRARGLPYPKRQRHRGIPVRSHGPGDYSTLLEASHSARAGLVAVEPDPVTSSEYQSYYESWLAASGQLAGVPL